MIYVYTSSAFNYLPKVKLLTESVRKFLPAVTMVLALADEIQYNVDFKDYNIDEVIPIHNLRGEFDKLESWIFQHSIVELATAFKPFVLERLLSRDDCEAVLYFDPDIVLNSITTLGSSILFFNS